jgi:ssDNA-binding Zn-finger/Zn-ribbon topoisomerase 1
MGAICAYCGAGPMKLMNLYNNHFAKNKCPKLIFVDTQDKYMKKTKEWMEKGEGKMKATGKRKVKTKATEKTAKAKKQVVWDNLDKTGLTGLKD